jgi:hypothetical protein
LRNGHRDRLRRDRYRNRLRQDRYRNRLRRDRYRNRLRRWRDSLTGLTEWAERHRADIAEARAYYDREQDDPTG